VLSRVSGTPARAGTYQARVFAKSCARLALMAIYDWSTGSEGDLWLVEVELQVMCTGASATYVGKNYAPVQSRGDLTIPVHGPISRAVVNKTNPKALSTH